MTATQKILDKNRAYGAAFDRGDRSTPPARQVAVVACMDARMDLFRILGLELGEADVIRNAGGVISEDVIRSLIISQRLSATTEIVLIHHSDCGMLTFTDSEVKEQIRAEVGSAPSWAFEAFSDVAVDVQQSITRLRADPFIANRDRIRGFVFDVESGLLDEVEG